MAQTLDIRTYDAPEVVCSEWDPRAPEIASRVATTLVERMPSLRVEHVGSTAVPGCAGKRIVDLAVLYPHGQLKSARDLVDSLGFQQQQSPDAFPEERPMRVGAIRRAGQVFRLHLHIIAGEAAEAAELVAFRDLLRANSRLREAYVARKREIIASGVTDSLKYSYAKSAFVEQALGRT